MHSRITQNNEKPCSGIESDSHVKHMHGVFQFINYSFEGISIEVRELRESNVNFKAFMCAKLLYQNLRFRKRKI